LSEYNKEIAEGFELLTQGEFDKSLEKFIKAIEIEPEKPDAYSLASEAFVQIGDMENAKSHAEIAYKKDSEKPEYMLQYASLLYAAGDNEESLKLAGDALRKRDMAEIHLLKSNIYNEMEEDSKAVKEAKLAYEMEKTSIYGINYATILKDAGKIKESSDILKKFLVDEPENVEVPYLLFQNELSEGNVKDAMDYIVQCISMDDEAPQLFSELATLLDELGDRKLAEKYYTKALAISEGEPDYAIDLAEFLEEVEKYDEALEILEKSHDDEDPEYYFLKGRILMEKKDLNKAILNFDIAIEMGDDPEAKLNKGMSLMEMHRNSEAESILREVRQEDFQVEVVDTLLNKIWWDSNTKKYNL
jgi:tetratricopeptide (TPR) repeat protein